MLIVSHLVNNCLASCGTVKLIAVFTKALFLGDYYPIVTFIIVAFLDYPT